MRGVWGACPPAACGNKVGVQGAGAPLGKFGDFRGVLIRFALTESAQKLGTVVVRQSLS